MVLPVEQVWSEALKWFGDFKMEPEVEMCLRAVDVVEARDNMFVVAGPAEAIRVVRQLQVEEVLRQVTQIPAQVEFRITGEGRVDFLRVLSAYRVLRTDWPEPTWAVEGILPVGLSLLAGRQKIGKSWLALQLARAIATGGQVLGRRVEQGQFLYLALEDHPRRLQTRMRQQGWPESGRSLEDLKRSGFILRQDFEEQIGPLNQGGAEILAEQIGRRKYRLVVVDTAGRAVRGDQNDYEAMTAAMAPIQEMAFREECVVLVLDHHRKLFSAEPDVVLDIVGSTAKAAVADTVLGLYRERGRPTAVLGLVGRDVEEQAIRLQLDGERGLWSVDEQGAALELTERRQEILDALGDLGRARVGEIARAIEQNRGNTYSRLRDLVEAGLVERETNEEGVFYALGALTPRPPLPLGEGE